MNKKSLEFLEDLSNTFSPSGFEERAVEKWDKYIRENIDEVYIEHDTYGSSIVRYVSPRCENPLKRIMVCGHIDEVGMMVSHISDEGFIHVHSIGGIDWHILPTQKVMISTKDGFIPGVIGQQPIHMLERGERDVLIHELQIDIGAKDKEDAERFITIGDPMVIDTKFQVLLNDRVVGRGLDDKVGAWVVAELLIKLSKSESFNGEMYGVATTQEENGAYGAIMSVDKSYMDIKPMAAIALDVTFATDNQDICKKEHGDVSLNKGPAVSIGSVNHKSVSSSLIKVAKENDISIQLVAQPRWSGTDGDEIFNKRGGIPTCIVSIPNRYMHTPVEMVNLADLDDTVNLLAAWCEKVSEEGL